MCNLHVFVCMCVFAVFQNLVCIHVDNYNFMEIFFPPFLTTTSAAEANNRGRVEAKRSGSLSLFLLSLCLSLSLCSLPPLSLSFSPLLLPSVAHLLPWPGPPTFGALGGPRTIAISASVLKRPIMTST